MKPAGMPEAFAAVWISLSSLNLHDKVGGQDYLDALLLGDRHDLRDDLGAVLVVR